MNNLKLDASFRMPKTQKRLQPRVVGDKDLVLGCDGEKKPLKYQSGSHLIDSLRIRSVLGLLDGNEVFICRWVLKDSVAIEEEKVASKKR